MLDEVDGAPVMICRLSFSGELAYEIAVPARYGNALMARMMQVGADLGDSSYVWDPNAEPEQPSALQRLRSLA